MKSNSKNVVKHISHNTVEPQKPCSTTFKQSNMMYAAL